MNGMDGSNFLSNDGFIKPNYLLMHIGTALTAKLNPQNELEQSLNRFIRYTIPDTAQYVL